MSEFDRFDPKYGKHFRTIKRSKEESKEIANRVRDALETGTKKVRFTVHARKMCEERTIDEKDVLRVLKTGKHVETREYENRQNKFRENFEGEDIDGNQRIRVVIREEKNILIITVIDI